MWVRNAEPNRPEFALAVGAKGIPPNGPNFAPHPEDHLLRRLGRSARRLRRPRLPRRARYLPAARRRRDFLRVARVRSHREHCHGHRPAERLHGPAGPARPRRAHLSGIRSPAAMAQVTIASDDGNCPVARPPHSRGSGRLDLAADGTFTQASPSSTISSATVQLHASRARWRSGMSSATVTVTSTWSPILTGARKLSVCEM